MASSYRALRRRILTPNTSATKLSKRGFHEKSPAARDLLETVGEMFLLGYAYAAEARHPSDAVERLDRLTPQFRGFAYEGAGMGFAIRDGLPLGGGHHVNRFLACEGVDNYVYMVYVGVGWAMARLPRFRWGKVSAMAPDPLLRWLVLDGYGFHQAYFHTEKYVHQQYREPNFPWPASGPSWYADRVIDQGIGRAMWFVGGSDPHRVADLIDRFPESRRADLYCGSGLAATYAGAVDEAELRVFVQRGRDYLPQIAQASAFAATARVRPGIVIPHTELATRLLTGATPEQAASLSLSVQPDPPVDGEVPAFELWRRRIAAGLVALQEANP